MTLPWLESRALDSREMAHVRRRLIFDGFKWDPQTQDVAVLSPAPLVLRREAWLELATAAEALYAEAIACEEALQRDPARLGSLGLPRAVVQALRRGDGLASCRGPRVMRFDFHPTGEGWKVSEVNADVPGGYIEASAFPALVAPIVGAVPVGDPAAAIAGLAGRTLPAGAAVALAHATAYADDAQVMRFLAERLQAAGLAVVLVGPQHLRFGGGGAAIESRFWRGPVAAVLRFFPAEWLPALPREVWRPYFAPQPVLQLNPARALVLQSKRLPLLWSAMPHALPTWRRLLPETVDPRDAHLEDGTWVLKSVLGRVGDGVALPGVTSSERWRKARWAARLRPSAWVAQRRFESMPQETAEGPVHLCVGVFVLDGRAVGAYGRGGAKPLIDASARDVAVLQEVAAA